MTGGQKGYALHNHITFLKSFYIKQPAYLQKLNGEKVTRSNSHTWAPLSNTVQLYGFEGRGWGEERAGQTVKGMEYRTLILILILDAAHEKG